MLKCFSFFCKRAMNVVPIVTDVEGAKAMIDELRTFVDSAADAAEVVPSPALAEGAAAVKSAVDHADAMVDAAAH